MKEQNSNTVKTVPNRNKVFKTKMFNTINFNYLIFHSTGRFNNHPKIPKPVQFHTIIITLLSIIHISILPPGFTICRNLPNGWKTYNDLKYNFQYNCYKSLNLQTWKTNPEWNYHNFPEVRSWFLPNKLRNKVQKSINGNGKNTIQVYHWNMGPRHWVQKVDDIRAIVDDIKPEYMFISESNLYEKDPQHSCLIEGYDIIKPPSASIIGISRIILLVKQGMNFQLLPNLMNGDIASIWFKTGTKGRNKILVGGIYREHSIKGIPTPNNSGDDNEQIRRWRSFVSQWKEAGHHPSVILIGDMNLDILKWSSPERLHIPMIDMINEEIITMNFGQIIEGPTRFWANQTSSLIDHVWVNCVDKIIDWKNINISVSDHNLIGVIIRLKGTNNESQEHLKRSKKAFDPKIYTDQISKINWDRLYSCINIDVANSIFEEEMLNILDILAPMVKSQPQKTPSNWVSDETRNFMALRDLAKDIASKSQNANDWMLYRCLRNKCSSEVSKNRKTHFKKMSDLHCENNNSRGLFNMAKNRMGWNSPGPPKCLLWEGKMIFSPKKIADTMVNFFTEKTKMLREKLPAKNGDPLLILKNALSR